MKVVGIIPARYESARFPGKPLVDIQGKPMIQHVYERCQQVSLFEQVIVATDDLRIRDAVLGFGGDARMMALKISTSTAISVFTLIGETSCSHSSICRKLRLKSLKDWSSCGL